MNLLYALDLLGTAAFAASGAWAGFWASGLLLNMRSSGSFSRGSITTT